jgi:hypothetical protein
VQLSFLKIDVLLLKYQKLLWAKISLKHQAGEIVEAVIPGSSRKVPPGLLPYAGFRMCQQWMCELARQDGRPKRAVVAAIT